MNLYTCGHRSPIPNSPGKLEGWSKMPPYLPVLEDFSNKSSFVGGDVIFHSIVFILLIICDMKDIIYSEKS